MKFNVGQWFKWKWPDPAGKRAVISDYQALRAHQHFLADVALRGGLFSAPADVPGATVTEACLIATGRRLLALEILELAKMQPETLRQFVFETPPRRQEDR